MRRGPPAGRRGWTPRSPRSRCRRERPAPSPRSATRVLRKREPVPWVAVEIAPDTVWRSMSPRFSKASPYPHRVSLSWRSPIPRLDADEPRRLVDVEHAVEPAQVEHQPAGAGGVGERVPVADRAHVQPGIGSALDALDQLAAARRPLDASGHAALVARPVAPFLRHRQSLWCPTAAESSRARSEAEREGFEPPGPLRGQLLSRQPHSARLCHRSLDVAELLSLRRVEDREAPGDAQQDD